MHIPDGYLSPVIAVGMGVVTVPTVAVATRRVQDVLSNRTIPLLAIFSAMSFTIMMFNIPVPGGTTAHGVGATLIAIVLGPWAAVIGVSVALIIQALFFGDGGILAIFANCFNMAIVMPFVGYGIYRLLAGRSDILSSRRAWAGGSAAYIAMTASALMVGIELGIQPLLFTENGHALYSPYGLAQAVPAMLLAHVFGASVVEGLITYLGIVYLQKRHPEYLTRLRRVFATTDAPEGEVSGRPLWQLVGVTVAGAIGLLAIVGLALGGGDPARLFGADWSTVDWAAVASMLLIVGLIFVILVPLAWLILPRRLKRVGTAFTAVAVLAPLGLIAPGFAYGEGSTTDVEAAFGYVPEGLRQLSAAFSAPLGGYNLPLPFFDGANAALWHAAIGYEIAGMLGILLCGGAIYALTWILGRSTGRRDDGDDAAAADPTTARAA
ncbi:MAG TPA: cobalt transporter CbiM [Candidatus Limnocylindrales bacterium]